MAHRIINTPGELEEFTKLLSGLKLPLTVEWVQGRNRTFEQNKLQRLWLNEASEQLGDCTTEELRAEWKLRHGVPIMRRDNGEFRRDYDECFKPLPYRTKLRLFQALDVPVTRLMKVRQMVEYLDTVQRESLQAGIRLTDPDPDLAKYHARYRAKEAA